MKVKKILLKKDVPLQSSMDPELSKPTKRLDDEAVKKSGVALVSPPGENEETTVNMAELVYSRDAIKALEKIIKLDGEPGSVVYSDLLYSRLVMTQINRDDISKETKKSLGSLIGKAMKRACPEIGPAKKTGMSKNRSRPYTYRGVSYV